MRVIMVRYVGSYATLGLADLCCIWVCSTSESGGHVTVISPVYVFLFTDLNLTSPVLKTESDKKCIMKN